MDKIKSKIGNLHLTHLLGQALNRLSGLFSVLEVQIREGSPHQQQFASSNIFFVDLDFVVADLEEEDEETIFSYAVRYLISIANPIFI